MAKADSEGLARSIAEEQLTDVEKEKTVLELEIKELMNRHKTEISKKEHLIQIVSICSLIRVANGCNAAKRRVQLYN